MRTKDILAASSASNLLESHPYYKQALRLAPAANRELNALFEAQGKMLSQGEVHDLFLGVEKTLTGQGQNQTLLGKAGSALGGLGNMVNGIGRAIQDTTPVKGIDNAFATAKQKVVASLGKSKGGAQVLRALDGYAQMAKRHPNLHKALFATAAMIGGAATGGLAAPAIMGALKSVDSLIQGAELSTAVGQGAKTTAVGAAAAGVANAADAVSNMDLNPFDNDVAPVDPNTPPEVSDVYPDEADRGVKPGPDQPQPAPEVKPEPAPAPPKPVPPKPVPPKPAPAPAPDVSGGGGGAQPDFNPNSTEYLDATKQNIISQNMAQQPTGGDTTLAQDTVTRPAQATTVAEAMAAVGFTIIALPRSQMIDRENTVRSWALYESLGRPRPRSVQLTEDGVNTIFYNIDQLHGKIREARRNNYNRERSNAMGQAAGRTGKTAQQFAQDNPAAAAAIQTGTQAGEAGAGAELRGTERAPNPRAEKNQQGGTVFNRPANANDAEAMAKNAATSATNTRMDAGPVGKLPGGPAPAGNTMPYLAADPKGDYKTKYSGATSNALTRGAEGMLARAGNAIGDWWKRSTTKFEANQAKRRWKSESGEDGGDSNAIANFLVGQKVPQEVVQQVYQQLGLPAPAFGGGEGDGKDRNQWIQGLGGGPDMSKYADPTMGQADNAAAGAADATGAEAGAAGAKGKASTGAEEIASQAGGSAKEQKVARDIDQDIDDLIRNLRRVDNILQPAYVQYIRDALDRTFGPAQKAAPAAPAAEIPAASAAGTGGGVAPVPSTDLKPGDPGTITVPRRAAEGRRAGGRYIKEAKSKKLAREFENFVLSQE